MICSREADLRVKVAGLFVVPEWTAVANEAVMSHPPIICAGGHRCCQRTFGLAPKCRLIKPGAGGGWICHRNRKHTEKTGKTNGIVQNLYTARISSVLPRAFIAPAIPSILEVW
jgi:hypothetical protein